MMCLECNTEMEMEEFVTGKGGEEYQCDPYWKCPKCKSVREYD
jgi:DNA-directed RNA polymerase subunit RPC12/RpoP